MSDIKQAGFKGYILMGGVVAFFLFIVLVIYLYKYNQRFVPESPELYGYLSAVVQDFRA